MTTDDRAIAYAASVVDGRTLAGPHVRAGCRLALAEWDAPPDGHYYDPEAAALGVDWFEGVLRLGDAPFVLFDWQAYLVAMLFGWKRDNGTRRFRRVYWETGKGSGKTPLAAGVALRLVVADGEYAAEGYVAARTFKQCGVTFKDLCAIVEDTPQLRRRCKVLGENTPYKVSYRRKRATLERFASSASGEGLSGFRPNVVVIDEYHEHDTSDTLDLLAAGFKGRKQPLLLITTNAGKSLTSPCGMEHDYAIRVAEGKHTDVGYLPYVCALDDGDDVFDESVWPKTNPSLPAIPGHEYIRGQLALTKGMPSKRLRTEQLLFCRWTESTSPWIDPEVFDAVVVDDIRREGRCVAALDLSKTTDLTAGAVVWEPPDCDELHAEIVAWTPEDTVDQRAERDAAPYREWAEAGHLNLVPGGIMDYAVVARWLRVLETEHALEGVAYDAWAWREFRRDMDKLGIEFADPDAKYKYGLQLHPHPQGFTQRGSTGLVMSRSIDAAERAMFRRTLKVKRNPVLRSAMLGAVTAQDNSYNRRFLKLKSTTRIDPAVALVMGVGLATGDDAALQDWLDDMAARRDADE